MGWVGAAITQAGPTSSGAAAGKLSWEILRGNGRTSIRSTSVTPESLTCHKRSEDRSTDALELPRSK